MLAPAVELLRRYRARKTSPLEVMQATLARIDAVNSRVNAIVTLARDAALQQARRAATALRRGAALPPLHGLPIGIKDVTPTQGLRTTYGSTLFAERSARLWSSRRRARSTPWEARKRRAKTPSIGPSSQNAWPATSRRTSSRTTFG